MSGSKRGNGRTTGRRALLGAALAVSALAASAGAQAQAQAAVTGSAFSATSAFGTTGAIGHTAAQRVRHIVAPVAASWASGVTSPSVSAPVVSAPVVAAPVVSAQGVSAQGVSGSSASLASASAPQAAPVPAQVDAVSCTTPAVPMYHVDALAQLRRWGLQSPVTGSPGWTGQLIGTGWSGLNVISGGDGVIYTIDSAGNLHWYSDGNFAGGGPAWDPASGAVIGTGWGSFTKVISGGDGVFYAVDSAGNLHWYRDLAMNGTANWAPNSGAVIGTGWGTPTQFVAGGQGVLYAVQPDGTLVWFRHLSPMTGTASWADGGIGKIIGAGWGNFTRLASMGGGVLLARDATGTAWWYRSTDPLGGSGTWANGGNGIPEGAGWSNTQLVTDIDGCTAT